MTKGDDAAKTWSLLIFAGPSGGHLFPAVAFGESFRRRFRNSSIVLVTSERGRSFLNDANRAVFDDVIYLHDFPFPARFSWSIFPFLIKLLRAFLNSFRILSRVRPDLSVGFGSYLAFPGILISSWRNIPTLIHEQNRIPGKATQGMSRFAKCVAFTFEESMGEIRTAHRELVGFPIRDSLVEGASKKEPRRSDKPFTILVTGGSQGARRLNEVVLETFSALEVEEKVKIAVIHITGNADLDWIRRRYSEIGVVSETTPFASHMAALYQRVDMVIARSGAGTLFELALFGLPSIIIPYTFAAAHQRENAEIFARKNAILCCEEADFSVSWLLPELRDLVSNDQKRQHLSESIMKMNQSNASEKLAQLAQQLLVEKIS